MIKVTLELPHSHPAFAMLTKDWESVLEGKSPRVYLGIGADGEEDQVIPMSGIVSVNHSCEQYGSAQVTIEFVGR